LIGWMIGTDIASYRVVHWQHPRKIGTVEDSEFTYFFPLNLLFLIRCAFGIRVIEVFLAICALTAWSQIRCRHCRERTVRASLR
jgi:hypothetical protein